jgi:hypothetical protein
MLWSPRSEHFFLKNIWKYKNKYYICSMNNGETYEEILEKYKELVFKHQIALGDLAICRKKIRKAIKTTDETLVLLHRIKSQLNN